MNDDPKEELEDALKVDQEKVLDLLAAMDETIEELFPTTDR